MESNEENLLSKDGVGNSSNLFLDRSKVRILLCDNDYKSSEEIFSLLCKCSYQVTSVRSARQVIDALNAEGPDIDIILAEVDLPMAKGLKMLKYIMRDKELWRIPIIMMSAQDDVSVVVKCLRLGAADYLVKPLRTNELLNLWTHMWRRRRMLGLAEKNILNNDFDLVASDPSDANTNSSSLFSDDTDDKSQRSTLPEGSIPNHWEDGSNAAAAQQPPLKNSFQHNPDVPEIRDQRTGQISCPKKTKLKVGEFSAFFSYVKSTMPANNSQSAVDKNAAELEYSSGEERLQEWCKQVGDDAHKGDIGEAWENYSQDNRFTNSKYGPDSTSSSTPLVPLGFPPQRDSEEEQLSTVLMHPRNESQVDVTGVPAHNHLPYYMSGLTNQVIPSSAQPYQNNLHDLQKHATSAMVPQYNHLPQCPPHVPVMATFPNYPVSIYLQSGPTQLWPSIGSSSSTEVKPNRVDRRVAALIKFRQKKKERCFGKKIRYVNRK